MYLHPPDIGELQSQNQMNQVVYSRISEMLTGQP